MSSEKLSEKLEKCLTIVEAFRLLDEVRALEAERDEWKRRAEEAENLEVPAAVKKVMLTLSDAVTQLRRVELERDASRAREAVLIKLNDELQAMVDELEKERKALIADVRSAEKQRDYARLEADTLAKRVAILENMLANLTTPEAINASPESGLLP